MSAAWLELFVHFGGACAEQDTLRALYAGLAGPVLIVVWLVGILVLQNYHAVDVPGELHLLCYIDVR